MRNPMRKLCKLQNHTRVEEGWARVLGVVGSPRRVCYSVCVCVFVDQLTECVLTKNIVRT